MCSGGKYRHESAASRRVNVLEDSYNDLIRVDLKQAVISCVFKRFLFYYRCSVNDQYGSLSEVNVHY